MSLIVPVIMCGGVGSRLWPSSRSEYPKQFLSLIGDQSMLQETILRLDGIDGLCDPILITNEKYRFTVAEQMQQIGKTGSIILEPEGRNTAPAIALAALFANQKYEDAVLVVLASDHVIKDAITFREKIVQATLSTHDGSIVTFGIVPTAPETGYGYIKVAVNLEEEPYSVEKFVEKPSATIAESYLKEGGYYWNSGMFVMKANNYLDELRTFEPEIEKLCVAAMGKAKVDFDFIRPDAKEFLSCKGISIDYAVMEKSSRVKLIPLNAGWSDVGSWSEVYNLKQKDDDGNAVSGDAFTIDCQNTFVSSSKKRFIAAIGLKNILVIDTADALLMVDMSKAQDVKKVVDYLVANDREEAVVHRTASRPWGHYECIDIADRFKVKRITVKPGASLSVQKHFHRAEHWVVVKGTAEVQKDDVKSVLVENESTYLPIGSVHSLHNPGKIDLEIIEVQTGSYLHEDDIVRLNDQYGREDS